MGAGEGAGYRDPDGRAEERALALRYAPASARDGLAALLALDARLGAILRTTREPLIGQMRLTWWHQALVALDHAPPPAEPMLQRLADLVVPDVAGAQLAMMVEGWEVLLDPELDGAALQSHGDLRGGALFGAMATLCNSAVPQLALAGRGWALADLSRHVRDPRLAPMARHLAQDALRAAMIDRWPTRARAIGALTRMARMDIQDRARPPGHPARAARLLWHRLSGR